MGDSAKRIIDALASLAEMINALPFGAMDSNLTPCATQKHTGAQRIANAKNDF
jgi:hypothetical protein